MPEAGVYTMKKRGIIEIQSCRSPACGAYFKVLNKLSKSNRIFCECVSSFSLLKQLVCFIKIVSYSRLLNKIGHRELAELYSKNQRSVLFKKINHIDAKFFYRSRMR